MHLKSPLSKKQKEKAASERLKLIPKDKPKVVRRILPPVTKPFFNNTRYTRPGSTAIPSKESVSAPDSCSIKNDVPDEVRLKFKNQLAPLYNKGPYMLITSPEVAKDIGKKTSELE